MYIGLPDTGVVLNKYENWEKSQNGAGNVNEHTVVRQSSYANQDLVQAMKDQMDNG